MVNTNVMNVPTKIFLAILVLFLPAVLLAIILPVNEYDCDAPLAVFILVIPIYLLYGAGFIFFARSYLKKSIRFYLVLSVICCIILVVITPKTISAMHELTKVNGTLNCEAKYNE